MVNRSGPQPDIQFCPICHGALRNIPREEMLSKGYVKRDGSVSMHTHTYECSSCHVRFEINQNR